MRFHTSPRAFLPALAVLALAACNDEPDFNFGEWVAELDTATLYSADLVEYQGLPAAYDIRATRPIRLEDPGATGNWDFVLTGGAGSALTLTPLGAFFDVETTAGVHVSDGTFEEIESAPSANSAYVTDAPVALQAGVVYIIRSRTGGTCNGMNFAKLLPLEIDQAEGTMRFQLTANPNCNDTDLVPPED